MGYFYTEYWTLGISRSRMGTANHLSVPNQAFPTKDGSVVIIAPGDDMWKRCARALDPERLDRPEYDTMFERRERREELIAMISEVTGGMTSDEVVARLGEVKVNVARVNTIAEAAEDSQLRAIGGVHEFTYGPITAKATAAPFAMEGTPLEVRRGPPHLGAESGEILREFGFDDEAIKGMAEAGAFGSIAELS